MNMITMEKSKSLAAIIGPTLVVMVVAELKFWNPTLYDQQIPPVVYLSGVLLFIAGIAVIRTHSLWVMGWQIILTIIGWAAVALGSVRIFFPEAYTNSMKYDHTTLVVEIILIITGLFLTLKAYSPSRKLKN